VLSRVPVARTAVRLTVVLAVLAALFAYGSGLTIDPDARASESETPDTCPQTVMTTLGSVLHRVYEEGVSSERTLSAEHIIERSAPLRAAIEADSPSAARAAAHELLKTGHMTNLTITVSGRKLIAVGGAALTPLHGTITGASGKPIATYLTSVWADSGFSSEASGVAQGLVSLRAAGKTIGGTLDLPAGPLPDQGSLTRRGVVYQYTSFAAAAFPSGSLRVYLLKPLTAVETLCGASDEDTQVNTLTQVADLIYEGESGSRTLVQVHRVQTNQPLLRAVAAHDDAGVRAAVAALLHHHLVRLRVLDTSGHLLEDLGGPFVLAPVKAKLKLHGKTIGSIVLSIQDDEGYLRLTHRLAGLDVLMYMRGPSGKSQLVKNSLGPGAGGLASVPASGSYTYKGKRFRVFTVRAGAFPSGPLTIRVLIPEPYS
jgi:hypothetical protein